MQKLKRIFALIGAILLIGMYVVVLILGLTASPATNGALMAAIACTVVIPVLIYAMMLMARVLGTRNSMPEDSPAEETDTDQTADTHTGTACTDHKQNES